jgi:hypothetical protein
VFNLNVGQGLGDSPTVVIAFGLGYYIVVIDQPIPKVEKQKYLYRTRIIRHRMVSTSQSKNRTQFSRTLVNIGRGEV